MSRRDGMPGGKRRATDHELHVLGDDFFVAYSVLYRADCAFVVKNVGYLCDGRSGMDRLGRDNAVIAARQLCGIAGGVEPSGEIGGSGKSQSVGANRGRMLLPDVVGPDFGLSGFGQMCRKQATDGPAA